MLHDDQDLSNIVKQLGIEAKPAINIGRDYSDEEKSANARKINAQAKQEEEKLFQIKLKRWAEGILFGAPFWIVLTYLIVHSLHL